MRHPNRLLGRRSRKQLRLLCAHRGLAELRHTGSLDATAELPGHQLHPVANAERRNPELEDPRIDLRRTLGVDRCRPAAENHRMWITRADLLRGDAVTDELRVHPALANAPRDQLRILPTEIQHQHRALLRRAFGQRQNLSADTWVPLW